MSVVVQHAMRGTVQILELAVLERPEKGDQADQPEKQGGGNEEAKRGHCGAPAGYGRV